MPYSKPLRLRRPRPLDDCASRDQHPLLRTRPYATGVPIKPRGTSYRGMRVGSRVRLLDGSAGRVVALRVPERVLLTPWRMTPALVQVEEQGEDGPHWMRADAITEVVDG